jgi:hypothetical protein
MMMMMMMVVMELLTLLRKAFDDESWSGARFWQCHQMTLQMAC